MREHFPFFQQASQTARPTFFRCLSLGFRLDVSWDGKHARLLFVQRCLRTMLLVLVCVSWSKATDPTTPLTVLAYYTLSVPNEATRQHLGLDYITDTDKAARGPVQVSYTGVVQEPLSKAWVDTFKGLKYGMAGDPFSCKSVGGYANAATVDHSSKTRSYTATAYYAPISQRTNLSVMTGAQVKEIEFTQGDDNMIANTVNFNRDGKSFRVEVRKEVILAAGAFQSPKILELSGISNPQRCLWTFRL